jgi:hypothetical protein
MTAAPPEQPATPAPAEAQGVYVWGFARQINSAAAMQVAGGIAAPLLAGFSLAAVAQLATADHPPRLGWLAEALFTAAAALLLFSLQFTAVAVGYAATPSERLDYLPETRGWPQLWQQVLDEQWQDRAVFATYRTRAANCYTWGLLAFLVGLGAVVWPKSWNWSHPPTGNLIAIVVIGFAVVLELIWTLKRGNGPAWLLPGPRDVTVGPHQLAGDGYDAVFGPNPETSADPQLAELISLLRRREERELAAMSDPAGAEASHDRAAADRSRTAGRAGGEAGRGLSG